MIIELHGGPLDGVIHEVQAGFPPPDRLALPDPNGNLRHWYQTREDRAAADFISSEEVGGEHG